jgi:hypothetical protein
MNINISSHGAHQIRLDIQKSPATDQAFDEPKIRSELAKLKKI